MDALILAGGKSSRMGGLHKGNLRIGEESFTQRLVCELQPHVEHILLSYGETVQQELPGCLIIQDEYKDCGPMGGLHAGLKSCCSELLLVSACDTPLLKWELYAFLLSHLQQHDAVVPVADGKIHPLTAIYRKSFLPVFEQGLQSGNYRLRSALEQADVCYVDVPQFASMLKNINTMEEYQALSIQ